MPVGNGMYYFASEAENFSRPPVILIHGAGGHHLFWPPQVRRLHNQRMIAVDLAGHGKSGGIGHHMIQEYAEDVMGFVAALRLNKVVLVGHSMGGAIALHLAAKFSTRVLGLGLIGTGAKLRVAPEILRSTTQESTFAAAVKLVTEKSFGPQAGKHLKEVAGQRLGDTRPSVLHGDFLACDSFDATALLSNVSAPTLILCGTDDQMTPPRYSTFLHEKILNSNLQLVSGAGHMLMLERPDEVAGRLSAFLDGITYRPGL